MFKVVFYYFVVFICLVNPKPVESDEFDDFLSQLDNLESKSYSNNPTKSDESSYNLGTEKDSEIDLKDEFLSDLGDLSDLTMSQKDLGNLNTTIGIQNIKNDSKTVYETNLDSIFDDLGDLENESKENKTVTSDTNRKSSTTPSSISIDDLFKNFETQSARNLGTELEMDNTSENTLQTLPSYSTKDIDLSTVDKSSTTTSTTTDPSSIDIDGIFDVLDSEGSLKKQSQINQEVVLEKTEILEEIHPNSSTTPSTAPKKSETSKEIDDIFDKIDFDWNETKEKKSSKKRKSSKYSESSEESSESDNSKKKKSRKSKTSRNDNSNAGFNFFESIFGTGTKAISGITSQWEKLSKFTDFLGDED